MCASKAISPRPVALPSSPSIGRDSARRIRSCTRSWGRDLPGAAAASRRSKRSMGQDIAVVTGASGGIGGAIARKIHERSQGELRLALHCRQNLKAAKALAAELPGSFVVQADLSHASGREALLRAALE